MSFAHTQPGIQSEVYLDVQVQAGTTVTATLTGPGVVGSAEMSASAATGGQVRLTWTVNLVGAYAVNGTAGTSFFTASVQVQ
jgi:hypothetical protein